MNVHCTTLPCLRFSSCQKKKKSFSHMTLNKHHVIISKMAAAPRALRLASRGLSTLFRQRQSLATPISSLICTQNRSLQTRVEEYWKNPVSVAQTRWYGDAAASMTEAELCNRVVNVVKMFDKVTPDKVCWNNRDCH